MDHLFFGGGRSTIYGRWMVILHPNERLTSKMCCLSELFYEDIYRLDTGSHYYYIVIEKLCNNYMFSRIERRGPEIIARIF
jgi:hypothetical protein